MEIAFLFPGQGAQAVGMGADIAAQFQTAATIYERANEIVGYDLRKLCFEGPQEQLNTTTVSQPAIFVTSVAILEVLRSEEKISFEQADVTAGLSLGEYSALYAAGAIGFEDGLRLVQKRGQAMQEAAESTEGSMVSMIGLDEQKVSELCAEAREGEILGGVNYNCPGQIVVSGSIGACDRAEKLAEKYGAIKAVRLSVAGAFHTEMMSSAAEKLEAQLNDTQINLGEVSVIKNIDAEYYEDGDDVRKGLSKQLCDAILWQKCMEKLLADGVEKFYEIGPGRVLTGLMRRINRKIKVVNISGAEGIKKLMEC